MSGSDAFEEFTEEDWARIDAICSVQEATARQRRSTESSHALDSSSTGQSISVDPGSSTDITFEKARKPEKQSPSLAKPDSPYLTFRGTHLSVSDIAGPAWCEVQYEYGLRQGRAKPLASRAQAFTTEKGNVIIVKQKVAENNEARMSKGRVIHKKLEKQIHPEEVQMKARSQEERWATRVIDMLSRLKVLMETGQCREVPVWGFVQGQPLFGIIDEIALDESSTRLAIAHGISLRESKSSSTIGPLKMSKSISLPRKTASLPRRFSSQPRKKRISIADNKTRQVARMPSNSSTAPNRLQVMLYRKLLSKMIHTAASTSENLLDLERYWKNVGLDPALEFSDKFRTQIIELAYHNGLDSISGDWTQVKSLNDMAQPFWAVVKTLADGWELTQTLRLVYHHQLSRKEEKKKQADSVYEMLLSTIRYAPKFADHNDGIKLNQQEVSSSTTEVIDLTAPSPPASHQELSPSSPTGEGKGDKLEEPADQGARSPEALQKPQSVSSKSIIGTIKFQYRGEHLYRHIKEVLGWWYGLREPRGVEIEETWKCNSCEYMNGCEWREAKALEMQQAKATTAELEGVSDMATTAALENKDPAEVVFV